MQISSKKIIQLAQQFEEKLSESVDPDVVITEHEGVEPKAYMAFSNLKNIITDASELLAMLNDEDVLPQWADEAVANAKMNIAKIMGYVRSEKMKVASASKGCSQCNDVHCCMNFAKSHSFDDVNEAKCKGYKKAPVGSPKQRSFCARHCAMKKKLTSKEVANDPDSCINKGLRRWKCRCR